MTVAEADRSDPAVEYVRLGLRLGRHNPDLVDSYYGPPELRLAVDAEPMRALPRLRAECRELIARLDAGEDPAGDDGGTPAVAGQRRRWLRSQLVGLETTIASMAGEPLGYEEEVRAAFGVRPRRVDEDEIAQAHRRLDGVLPGSGDVRDRMVEFRDRHAIPVERLPALIADLADDLRERTASLFGLPDGEHVHFELVSDRPWSGFNYYEGDLTSRVAINTDLPVPSSSIGHLIAHEAYPGHHTEGCRKEVGLARARKQVEETIALIGTPSCTLAEGLADLGLEVLLGAASVDVVGEHVRRHGVTYESEVIGVVSAWSEVASRVRGNLALLLHVDAVAPAEVVEYAQRWLLMEPERAAKAVQFLTDPTWRAYIFCYIEGLDLCRAFVAGDPARFARLVSEQLTPADLAVEAA